MTCGAVQSGVDLTKSMVTSGVHSVMGSRVGQMVMSGVDTVLGRSEAWMDNHLPMTNDELGECGGWPGPSAPLLGQLESVTCCPGLTSDFPVAATRGQCEHPSQAALCPQPSVAPASLGVKGQVVPIAQGLPLSLPPPSPLLRVCLPTLLRPHRHPGLPHLCPSTRPRCAQTSSVRVLVAAGFLEPGVL